MAPSGYPSTIRHRLRDLALDLFFPQRCVGCGTYGQFICEPCVQGLPRILPPVCTVCGKPQPRGGMCPGCWGWRHSIDGMRSPFSFEGALRESVHALKYRNLRALSRPLAALLAGYLKEYPLDADVLVPVPLHRRRMAERGYNQAALLAHELGNLAGIPVDDAALMRRKDTLSQARTPTAEQRQLNVSNAFFAPGRRLMGRRVVIVDDVCTSGATLDACAVAARKAGAVSVWGLTLGKEL